MSQKPTQHQDGVSIKPLLTQSGSIAKRSLFWHYPHYHRTKPYGTVRNGDYKLIEFFEEGTLEFYDLKKYIAETTNLAESMPEKAAELLNELKGWRISVNAQMPTPNPKYDPTANNKNEPALKATPFNALPLSQYHHHPHANQATPAN